MSIELLRIFEETIGDNFVFLRSKMCKNGPPYCLWMFLTINFSNIFNNFLHNTRDMCYIEYLNMVLESLNKTIHFYSGVNTYTYTNCEIAQWLVRKLEFHVELNSICYSTHLRHKDSMVDTIFRFPFYPDFRESCCQ